MTVAAAAEDGLSQFVAPVCKALVLVVLVLSVCCVLVGFLPVGSLQEDHMT